MVDTRDASLYVGEEEAGIWRFGAESTGPVDGTLIARAMASTSSLMSKGLRWHQTA